MSASRENEIRKEIYQVILFNIQLDFKKSVWSTTINILGRTSQKLAKVNIQAHFGKIPKIELKNLKEFSKTPDYLNIR